MVTIPVATKFVKWNIPALETLRNSKVYEIRLKLDNNERLSREEKEWITKQVYQNSYFNNGIPLGGWLFDFSDVLKNYIINQYGRWTEYKAVDKMALRKILCGRIDKIVEVPERKSLLR